MAYAPMNYDYTSNAVVGSFVETEFGKTFEYTNNPEVVYHVPAHGGRTTLFPHLIFVGPTGEETRMALVKGSVAHVVTGEREYDGRTFFVVEKWNVKKHRKY